MCEICQRATTTSKLQDKSDGSILPVIGVLRRKQIHNNRTKDESSSYQDSSRREIPEKLLRAEWKQIEQRKKKAQQGLRTVLAELFSREIRLFLQRFREKIGLKKARKKPEVTPLIVDTVLDWARWFELTKDNAEPQVESITKEGFENALARIGTSGPNFSASRLSVRSVIEELVNEAANTQQSFRRIATETIQRGLEEGDDLNELTVRVANKTEAQLGYRLDRIVQTTGQGAFEKGQREGFRAAGIEQLRWLTQRDARVRSPAVGDKWDHRGADGQVVDIDNPFLLFGSGGISETLMHPGDPGGSPGNIIYCRCSQRPVK